MPQTNVLDEIEKRLQNYPKVSFRRTETLVEVMPSTSQGFQVSLTLNGDAHTLAFDGWHGEFEDAETALNGFAFGLSEDYRLEVTRRGRFRCPWTVQQ